MNKGKSWSKPQLILLAKGTADECVLATCKSYEHPEPALLIIIVVVYCHTCVFRYILISLAAPI